MCYFCISHNLLLILKNYAHAIRRTHILHGKHKTELLKCTHNRRNIEYNYCDVQREIKKKTVHRMHLMVWKTPKKTNKMCLRTLFIYDRLTGIDSRCFPSDSVKGKIDALHTRRHLCTFSINVSRLSLPRFCSYERQGQIWAASICRQTPDGKIRMAICADNCYRIPTLQLPVYFHNQNHEKSVRVTYELLKYV